MEDRLKRKNGQLPPLPTKKEKKAIPKVSKKKAAEQKETKALGEDSDLRKWYASIMQKEDGKCWETGERINKKDTLGWHGSIAHILPKSLFPSVASHPLNYMILSMWNGSHANYDNSWERAAKMKVWGYALKTILNTLYPLLTPEEKRKLPDVIQQEIDPLKNNHHDK